MEWLSDDPNVKTVVAFREWSEYIVGRVCAGSRMITPIIQGDYMGSAHILVTCNRAIHNRLQLQAIQKARMKEATSAPKRTPVKMQFYLRLLASCSIPIVHLLLCILVFHFIIHSQDQNKRLLLLPVCLFFAVLSFTTCTRFSAISPFLSSLWAQSVALNIVHITSLVCIERWPALQTDSLATWNSLHATWRLWSNPQLLPTTIMAKTTNKKDGTTTNTTIGEESIPIFLLLRLLKLPLYYYLYTSILPSIFYETMFRLDVSDVTETALFTRLGDVTTREIVVRSYTAVIWIWESVVMLDGANAVLAIVAVLSGLDKPKDWPTLFGTPSAACGVRNFWSLFWHHLAVRPYGNFGRLVAGYIPVGSKRAQKSVVASVIFLLSGLSHSAVSWRLGHVDWGIDLQWFMFNFAACSAELVVVTTGRDVARRLGLARELALLETSWLGYLIGYAWVFGFFFWTVPMWRFPRLQRQLDATDRLMKLLSKMTLIPKEGSDMA